VYYCVVLCFSMCVCRILIKITYLLDPITIATGTECHRNKSLPAYKDLRRVPRRKRNDGHVRRALRYSSSTCEDRGGCPAAVSMSAFSASCNDFRDFRCHQQLPTATASMLHELYYRSVIQQPHTLPWFELMPPPLIFAIGDNFANENDSQN